MRVTTAVICPDKFRGSLSAPQAARAMAAGFTRAGVETLRVCPLADGGEGTLDTVLEATGGSRRRVRVSGPMGEPVDARYGVLDDGTAVIEMAQASGLSLIGDANDPLRASTRGTGEMIRAAADGGARRILVGMGGSATTDGGLAAVQVLGWSLRGLDVTVACDVSTKFVDAAALFAAQKGASDAQVRLLGRRLEQIAAQYLERTGVDVRDLRGAGAAGGLAGGLAALGARLEPGFEVVAEVVGLHELLDGADLVVTGEGALDETSLAGKVVGGVLALAEELGISRRVVITGRAGDDACRIVESRGAEVHTLAARAQDLDDAMARAASLVEEIAAELV